MTEEIQWHYLCVCSLCETDDIGLAGSAVSNGSEINPLQKPFHRAGRENDRGPVGRNWGHDEKKLRSCIGILTALRTVWKL